MYIIQNTIDVKSTQHGSWTEDIIEWKNLTTIFLKEAAIQSSNNQVGLIYCMLMMSMQVFPMIYIFWSAVTSKRIKADTILILLMNRLVKSIS